MRGIQILKTDQESNRDVWLKRVASLQLGLTLIQDLNDIFPNMDLGAPELLAGAVAVSFSDQEIEILDRWCRVLVAIPAMTTKVRTDPRVGSLLSALLYVPKEIVDIVELVVERRGVSQNSLKRFAELLRVPILPPGRPIKDYSKEFELRISGSTWSDIARYAVANRSDFRAELDGKDYDTLDPVTQKQIWNRVRQGVHAYADRIGKPLSSDAEPEKSAPGETK